MAYQLRLKMILVFGTRYNKDSQGKRRGNWSFLLTCLMTFEFEIVVVLSGDNIGPIEIINHVI